ncbi:hypothetical protein E4U21_004619 [Claviceps maximensis]|nr:hypothetical protein E4U21_004619 [Claviceps maximensis]
MSGLVLIDIENVGAWESGRERDGALLSGRASVSVDDGMVWKLNARKSRLPRAGMMATMMALRGGLMDVDETVLTCIVAQLQISTSVDA